MPFITIRFCFLYNALSCLYLLSLYILPRKKKIPLTLLPTDIGLTNVYFVNVSLVPFTAISIPWPSLNRTLCSLTVFFSMLCLFIPCFIINCLYQHFLLICDILKCVLFVLIVLATRHYLAFNKKHNKYIYISIGWLNRSTDYFISLIIGYF